MTEFLAVSWYLVPTVAIAIASVLAFVIFGILHIVNKSSYLVTDTYAKGALVSLASLMLCFLWPLTLVVLFMFIVFTLVKDVFTSKKEN